MSDATARAHERAACMGDPEAEERVIVQRARAGEIGVDRLTLAALCGSGAARRLLGPMIVPATLTEILRSVEILMRGQGLAPRTVLDGGWKEAGVLATVAMGEAACRAHHARARFRASSSEDRHATGSGARAAHAHYDHEDRPGGPRLSSCASPTCDLAVRSARAAREWVTNPDLRAPAASLCFTLARMQDQTRRPTNHPWREQELEITNDLWVSAACAMAAHEGGRADLLERCRVSTLSAMIGRAFSPGADDQVEAHATLRAAVCRELVAWCLR